MKKKCRGSCKERCDAAVDPTDCNCDQALALKSELASTQIELQRLRALEAKLARAVSQAQNAEEGYEEGRTEGAR